MGILLLQHVEESNKPGSCHHQKAFEQVEGTDSSLRAEENYQLCLVFLQECNMVNNFFLYGLSLPVAIHDGCLNAPCYGIRSVCTRRSEVSPDATELLPSGFAAEGQQMQLANVQTGNAGVCCLSHVCPRGQRAEPAAHLP